jgi:hypothetical protein
MRSWRQRFSEWWVRIPILLGPRGRCWECSNVRERAFRPGDRGYDQLKPSIYADNQWRHGHQPPGEDCTSCGAAPGIWQR